MLSAFIFGDTTVVEGQHKTDSINKNNSQLKITIDQIWPKIDLDKFIGAEQPCLSDEGVIKPKAWKIEDKTFLNEKYRYLFVFYLLPQNASVFHANGWWISKNDTIEGPICNIFNGTKYKLLMHGHEEIPSTTTTTTTKPTTETTIEITTTKNQMETTTGEPSPSSPSNNKTFIIVIVVSIVIFIATFIVLLICLSLCCKKSGKDQTVKMATARSTDSYMIADRGKPKIEAKEDTYDDTPTKVTYATDLQVKKYVSSTNIGEGTTVVGS
uniref:Uncharacterized protein n=1 Tax=Meloidogyne floridensis TaxID=298350 RepID=A0A915NYT3_9BILA